MLTLLTTSALIAKLIGATNMNTCINCGKPTHKEGFFVICDDCEDMSNHLTSMLKRGITVEYNDGSVETIFMDNQNGN